MNEVQLLYSCDAWHSWASHKLIGVFSDRKFLEAYFDKMEKAGILDSEDRENLSQLNQTQGHETNFDILTEKLNPKYETR